VHGFKIKNQVYSEQHGFVENYVEKRNGTDKKSPKKLRQLVS
jgi:hypothetical protein